MNRAAWQKLALERLKDAKALLKLKRWAGAYYLAGYAVECGLKSCIIAYLMKTDAFPDKRYSELCWTHDLIRLVALAGLRADLDRDIAGDVELLKTWEIVSAWKETSRYLPRSKAEAKAMVAAVANSKHGMLSWIKHRW